ncbi:MAG: methionyl-tRNA formyltransferase [Bacteroidales bacterium]|nr:methionyl-tRNA formyltransferase [Bacteroidales bacterium]
MSQSPGIIFYGTPDFAVPSLDALVKEGFRVVGVVTVPDREAGRGLSLSQSAVKKYALGQNLPILQPEKLKALEFLQALEDLEPDLQVVVAFRMLPKEVWSLPRLGTFNLHASLLPQYRGAAPINRAIMNGEHETGVTTFFINEEIDTGALLLQEHVTIDPNENAGELHDRLMNIGAGLVVQTIRGILAGNLHPVAQEFQGPSQATLKPAPKLNKEDLHLNWEREIQEVYNQIRGLTPFPGVWTELRLKNGSSMNIKIGSARIADEPLSASVPPGSCLTDHKRFLKVAARNGYIDILTLQPASKKMMKVSEFLNGSGTLLA